MEDPNKDYLTSYRSFFETLLKSVDLDYPLPVKIPIYNLTEQEIAGEITTWCLQYLIERDCPTSLATILCRRVLDEISRFEPELCGYRPQEQVYNPLQLMQESIRKLTEVCTLYTDNARLSELPPPPSSILHDPIISMCGVKNTRRTMEDRHIAIQDLHTLFNVKNAVGPASYYAVFDGHNGCDAATYSSCHLHHYLVQSKHYPHNPEAALRDAFTTTDKRFIEKTAKGSLESGTTAVCALIRPAENMLYLAWLGDSQAVLVSKGVAYQLVKPHRPDQPEEMKRIKNMGGAVVLFIGTWRVDGNLAVSRAIGDKMYKPYIVSEPDIRVVPLTGKEDYLILASDGLWDYISTPMVVQAVDTYLAENKGEAGGVSKHLVQLAKKQCSRDNISCITVFLRDPSDIIDNRDNSHSISSSSSSSANMEVQDLEQQASVVDQLWKMHQNEGGNKPNGRMDEDDLGSESDVLLSPNIAAAKAAVSQAQTNNSPVWHQEKLQKEQQRWLKTLPWSYADAVRKSPPKKQLIQDEEEDVLVKVDEDLDQQHATATVESKQEVDNKLEDEPILQDPAVIVKGGDLKNYVGDNDIDSGEESEEEWNYIPGKENPKENLNPVQQIQQALNAEDDEDMESQLNPNAAEFVPVFIPPSSAADLEKDVSSSPAKGAERSLENVDVPSVKEFYCEISNRPSELESLEPNKSLNETPVNGVDLTGISTKAVYGGDDSMNFLSSVNSSTVANLDDDEDEAIEVPLNDTNPFSPTHVPVPTQPNTEKSDTIQEQMVQDHFSLGFKPFDPMTQSVTMMEDEGQHEDETSPDIDFMSSDKPDLLSPEVNQVPVGVAEALEAQTSSSGFDSESGPDDGDHIPAEQCNLAAAAAAVGISFGEDVNLEGIVNTKSMSLIDDSHPIEKIEQTISPSISPMPQQEISKEVKEEILTPKEEIVEIIDVKEIEDIEKPLEKLKEDLVETLLKVDEPVSEPEQEDILVQLTASPVETKHIEVKDVIFEEETAVLKDDVSSRSQQMVDLVQELQFNQEPSSLLNKIKEEEPESDSGFEIINASEASNEPDLIENEIAHKLQQNIEETSTSLLNGLVSNCVPDLLLQPSESDVDRQPSPIGIRTENIIADIEGAMLDSSPPNIQSNIIVDESFTNVEKIQEPLEVPLVSSEDNIKEEIFIESKSPIMFDLGLGERKFPLLFGQDKDTREFELNKSPVSPVEDQGSLLVDTPVKVDEEIQITQVIKEENKAEEISLLTEEAAVEEKQPIFVEEFKENIVEFKTVDQSPTLEEINKQIDDQLSSERKELITEQSPVKEKQEVEVIKETLLEVADVAVKEELTQVHKEIIEKTEEPLVAMTEVKQEVQEVIEIKDTIKERETLLPIDVEVKEKTEPPTVDEDKEVLPPQQPTPPTTPAPGVKEEDNKQELIAAAIAAAGVAAGIGVTAKAVSAAGTPKVEEKTASIQKKPTASSAPSAKKPDVAKTTAAKTPSTTTKSPLTKPAPSATATAKKTTALGSTAKPAPKPTGTTKPAATSSKPSTPTAKTAPSSRPSSAKPTTLATKTPPKPRTPTTTKPLTSTSSSTTTKAPGVTATKTMKPTAPSAATARPSSATTAKKAEPTAIKKPLASSATTAKPSTLTSKTSALTKAAPKPAVTKTTTTTITKSPISKLAGVTATKTTTTTTSTLSSKPLTKTIGNTTTLSKTTTTKTVSKTTTSKPTTANSTATKAPITKAKAPAAPTAIKKPLSADKNIKDATNNKLSAAKQATGGAAINKKQDVKTKQNDTTKVIEPLTQEPTVTTTNGHIENGISNEESSPVEIAPFPQIV